MADTHPVESRLAATWPPGDWADLTVLVAASGGADSTALLRAVAALKTGGRGRLAAVHFNHRLRGGGSDGDEAFVVDLCRRLDLPCQVGHAAPDVLTQPAGDGLEAAARTARYGFFRQTAERLGARYLVTAHTADDQAETILHRIVRGTGIGGLSGIARARPLGPAVTLLRPLLGFRRAELIQYLADLGQPYRTDHTNDDTRFTRNRLRHRLLPELAAQYNSGVVDALVRLGTLAGEAQSVIDRLVDRLADVCLAEEPGGAIRIDAARLADEPPYVVRELLILVWRRQHWPMQAMGYAQWDLLAAMIAAPNTAVRHTLPGNVLAESGGGAVRVERLA